MKYLKWIEKSWSGFWFESIDFSNLAAFRILYTGVLFLIYLSRQWDLGLFYSESGILPKNLALQILPEAYRPQFLFYFWNDASLICFHGLFVLSLLMICVGFYSRIFSAIAWYLHLSFLFRNYGVAFGVDQITAIWLFYLVFTESDRELSLRNFIKNRGQSFWSKTPEKMLSENRDLLTSVGYRLLQIQLCIIYFYSGIEKLKGSTWWDGTALWSVFANSQIVIADFTWMKHFPLAIVAISYLTILFEIYFPVLVWTQRWRYFLLSVGVIFHLGIGLTMALWAFALVMISPYFLFIEAGRLRQILGKFIR